MTISTKARMEVLHAALVEAQKRLSNGTSTVVVNKEGINKAGINKADINTVVGASDMSALINSAALLMIRDRIEFTHAFIESLNLAQYPPKSTFVFIAREIVVNAPSDFLGGVFFGDNHLIFMADVMDLSDGVWVINDTIAPLETQGAPGGDVKIVCRDLLGATVISMAGTGGPGKDGKNGADGPKQCEFFPDIGVFCEVGPGGHGGNGKDGAKGGNSGKITLSYVRNLIPGGLQPSPQSFPGSGGQGGAKGIGGVGDPNGNDGVGGKQGPDGDINAPVVSVISEATYWAQVREQLGGSLASWRELRLRSADYHFRAFRPTPERSHYLNLARDEAAAVMQLLPTPAEVIQADLIRTQFDQQLNLLGLERNSAPTFIDFPRYNRELHDYEQAIRDNFHDAVGGLLEVQVTQFSVGQVLNIQRGHLDSTLLKEKLQAEIEAANQGKLRSTTLLLDAEKRRKALQEQIKKLELIISAELPPGDIKLSNAITLAVGTVAALAVTFLAPPAAGAVAAALLPLAADLLGNSAMGKDMGDTLKSAKDVAAALKSKTEEAKTSSKGLNELAKDPAKADKDWKEPTFKMVLSFAKVAKDLHDAVATGDPRYAQLLNLKRELFAAMHLEFLAKLTDNQAKFALEAAKKAEELRVEDLARVNKALAELTGQDLSIRKGVLTAVRQARSIRNRLLWRVFNAARALDIYTLSYPPDSATSPYVDVNSPETLVRYDYGYIHPNDEAAYLDGSISHFDFQQRVRASMSVLESLEYDDAYDTYREKRSTRIVPGAIFTYPRPERADEQAATIKSLQETKRFFFAITPNDLRPSRHEAKVTNLSLTLEGVNTVANSFGIIIEHSGRSQQRWLPSAQANPPLAEQILLPSTDVIEMKAQGNGKFFGKALVTLPGENQNILLQCVGRGAASDWTVKLEAGSGAIDLSQLSGVTFEIEYESFFEGSEPNATSLNSIAHASGAVYPGATALATVKLIAPAPQNGLMLKLASNAPDVVKVPGGVNIPAGVSSVNIPMQVAPNAAGKSALLTATADFALHAKVAVAPAKAVRVLNLLNTSQHPADNVVVRSLAADDRFVYAPYYLSPKNGATPTELGFLAVIDAATWTVKQRIPVGDQPVSVDFHNNAQRRRLFVVNRGVKSFNLSVIDLSPDGASFKSLTPVPLAAGIWDVAVHQATARAYVTRGQGNLYVIDALATDPAKLLIEAIKSGVGLLSMSIDQAANRIYLVRSVQDLSALVERIERFDPIQKSFTPLPLPVLPPRSIPSNVAFDPDRRLYVTNLGNTPSGNVAPNVTVVDLNTNDVRTVRTSQGSWSIALDTPRDYAYVPTPTGLEVITRSNDPSAPYGVILRIAMGAFAGSVAVNPVNGDIYVGDTVDGSVRAVPAIEPGQMVTWK